MALEGIALTDYPKQTMARHQAAILNFYGFRAFKPYGRVVLGAEITRLVQSHLKPKLIFSRALEALVREKVEVPVHAKVKKQSGFTGNKTLPAFGLLTTSPSMAVLTD